MIESGILVMNKPQGFTSFDVIGKLRGILCAEMCIPALFAVDVQNVVHGRTPIDTALSSGGEIITADAIYEAAVKMYGNK